MTPEEMARELWWPHHQSRTRSIALAELDAGGSGEITLQFDDVVSMVEWIRDALKHQTSPGDFGEWRTKGDDTW
jgi:hypothetical protein